MPCGLAVVSWSSETERLGERYRVLYGVTQGTWATIVLCSLLSYERPLWQLVVLFAFGALTSIVWRRSWRKYRAAFVAETQKTIADAFASGVLLRARLAASEEDE